jgi:succinate dehydrogenase / fumarate reductase flavoprotein subunit
MGGLWVDYEKDAHTGGIVLDSPRNQQTNVPGLWVIGEADYQFHGANRLGANSLLSCIFSGLITGPAVRAWLGNLPGGGVAKTPRSVFEGEITHHNERFNALIRKQGTENPYLLHRELGELMTRNCTVVRNNADLRQTLSSLEQLTTRYQRVALADRGMWTNQNLSFTRALGDMLLLARVIAEGALRRDECRGAHYKPECAIPAPAADDPAELRRQATEWCQRYHDQNEKWLKTTIAVHTSNGPQFSYEPVDTSLIPPRPRTYGLKGAEIIEEVWRESYAGRSDASLSGAWQPHSAGAGT